MVGHSEVLKRVLSELNTAGVEHMLVGSLAASAHGYIRDTHDLDFVVVLDRKTVQLLAERMSKDFYFDVEGAEEAVEQSDMFNIIHYDSMVKVGFWPLRNDEFGKTQFSRRRASTVWGIPAYVESPEDTILSKLLWNKISPSDRQTSDVAGILLIKKDELDYDYLTTWAERQGVLDVLRKLMEDN